MQIDNRLLARSTSTFNVVFVLPLVGPTSFYKADVYYLLAVSKNLFFLATTQIVLFVFMLQVWPVKSGNIFGSDRDDSRKSFSEVRSESRSFGKNILDIYESWGKPDVQGLKPSRCMFE